VRIGIHSDAVLVGNIGSKERMSYTVMGDGVNVAARLEGINKEFRTRICISHAVFKETGERLCVRPIDEVSVKGRRSTVTIYEVLGAFGAGTGLEPPPEKLRLAELTRTAYAALIRDDKSQALALYRKALSEFPEDGVCQALVRRLAA
jgi:adenylate cyclase